MTLDLITIRTDSTTYYIRNNIIDYKSHNNFEGADKLHKNTT